MGAGKSGRQGENTPPVQSHASGAGGRDDACISHVHSGVTVDSVPASRGAVDSAYELLSLATMPREGSDTSLSAVAGVNLEVTST